MFKLIAVTNRHLSQDFLGQIKTLSQANVGGILLREKDLSPAAYGELAQKVQAICEKYSVPLFWHSFINEAEAAGTKAIHLPLPLALKWQKKLPAFQTIGVSVHSAEEARKAQALGATYLIAGHVFETNCKKGVPPRGLGFLQEVCTSVSLPVYAIGGITPANAKSAIAAGAAGVCMMSQAMQASKEELLSLTSSLKNSVKK